MKHKLIEDKTLTTYCRFVWDCTEQEFLDYVNKKNGTDWKPSNNAGKCVYHEDDEVINFHIWINRKNNLESLSHEVLHLIRFWLQDYRGIDLTEETDEIYTILHSFYFRECLKCLGLNKFAL